MGELKLNCITNQHAQTISNLKRKYEQKINELQQEKTQIEKKWKQKMIALHKQYGLQQSNNANININHIENITITPTTQTGVDNKLEHRNSDESVTYDEMNGSMQSSAPRSRRKRKRNAMNEFASDSNSNSNENNHGAVIGQD